MRPGRAREVDGLGSVVDSPNGEHAELFADDPAGRRRTRRFEWCVRLSVFVVMAMELVVLQVRVTSRFSVGELVLATLVLLFHVAANINLANRTLTASRLHHPVRRLPWPSIALCVAGLTAVTVGWTIVLGVATIPVAVFALGLSWAALAVALSWRVMAVGVVVIAAAFAVALGVTIQGNLRLIAGLSLASIVALAIIAGGVWLSGWMFRVYAQLDRARSDSARLAVAEERLRISRDLHDVFGRTMATVAVKSELAAELARRGRSDEAAAEIGQVQAIADDAGRQVRGVIRGYREADLAVELTGARSLLAAAGIDCTVRGSAADLEPQVTSVLAWVIREAVTNLIKHSDAHRVDIEVRRQKELTMIISNDGARHDRATSPSGGQGLVGMGERAASVGGVLQHEMVDDRFVLQITVPLPAKQTGGVRG